MARVCFTGSRHWQDAAAILRYMERHLERGDVVVVGCAKDGVDDFVRQFATQLGFDLEVYKADWKMGKFAGFTRNDEMAASDIDRVVAFRAGGKSNGTDHMVSCAKKRHIDFEIHHDHDTMVYEQRYTNPRETVPYDQEAT